MKKKLKLKILAGFMLLVALLMVAGAVSIIEFVKLSNSVSELIEDNYKTIEASKSMLEALERTDSGVLLLLLGERVEGNEILKQSEAQFSTAFNVAKNNITETNEDKYIGRINTLYSNFKQKVDVTFHDHTKIGDMNWYQGDVYKSFLEVKHSIDQLMALNQSSMYTEATMLKEKSHRAIMPGIIAIVGAVVFSLLLSFFISKYYVSPLVDLVEAIKSYNPRDKSIRSNIKSDDEIKRIEIEVNNLINRLVKHHNN
jgi:nitrate/nitrite-specific signal transduction histidine kinase